MRTPNILLVVWDACRLDAATEHAPTLAGLAESNLRFENAITPAGSSLPAHTSLFTGKYPHEHGIFSQEHTVPSLALLTDLGESGYTRYGVSANGFASAMYGFDRDFDRFYNTQAQMVYPEALDVHGYARRVRETHGAGSVHYGDLFRTIAGHDHSLKSLANVATAGLTEFVRHSSRLQRLPHPRFDAYSEFCYRPRKNTQTIRSILERESNSSNPFFVFTNYMDTHHPYAPPKRYRRAYCGRPIPYRELSTLADRTHPLGFIERHRRGERLGDDALRDARNLYAGEVRTADDHLGRLLAALDEHGLREDTLIVVTADHGENLGEMDELGETRFGHVCSASDALLRVPLVVAHPDLDGRRVEEYVSTKDLCGLCADPSELLASGGHELGALATDIVAGQIPASVNDALGERHPTLVDLLERHQSVAYADGWRMVADSTGAEYAWHEGQERNPVSVPGHVTDTCRDHLAGLVRASSGGRELTETEQSHLEALGYL